MYIMYICNIICNLYCTRAIITRSFYIFTPFLKSIFEVHFFVFKDIFSQNYFLSYGSIQERVMIACVQYSVVGASPSGQFQICLYT